MTGWADRSDIHPPRLSPWLVVAGAEGLEPSCGVVVLEATAVAAVPRSLGMQLCRKLKNRPVRGFRGRFLVLDLRGPLSRVRVPGALAPPCAQR